MNNKAEEQLDASDIAIKMQVERRSQQALRLQRSYDYERRRFARMPPVLYHPERSDIQVNEKLNSKLWD